MFDDYLKRKKLLRLPNPVKVFFKYQDDHEIERLSEQLEEVVQDLANTRSSRIIAYLNQLPILSAKAHTRPFDRKRYNVLAAICFPLGIYSLYQNVAI